MVKRISFLFLLWPSIALALGVVTGGSFTEKKGNSAFRAQDSGMPMLGVRNDGGTVIATSNLAYGPVSIDSAGRLNVVATLAEAATSTEGGTIDGASLFKLIAGVDASDIVRPIATTPGGSVVTDGSGFTQPISAVSLPLPTGAATLAEQVTQSTSLVTIATSILGVATAVKQDTGNTSLSSIDGKLNSLGQKASSASMPVVIASDQSGFSVLQGGKTPVDKIRNAYGSTPVTTAAYVQVIASLAGNVSECDIFDSSGQTLFLATGGAGFEVDQIYVVPGGNGRVPLSMAVGARVSLKAVSSNATAGEFDMTCYR